MPDAPILTWEQLAARIDDAPTTSQPLLREIITDRRPDAGSDDAVVGRRWFLTRLAVRGFIGIGDPAVELAFDAAPGLTIVTARNGVGKSSLALALRHLLGGSAITSEVDSGVDVRWANLHESSRHVRAEFHDVASTASAIIVDTGISPRFTSGEGEDQPVPQTWTEAKSAFEPVLIYGEIAAAMQDDQVVNEAWVNALALKVLTSALAASEGVQRNTKGVAVALRKEREKAAKDAAEFVPHERDLVTWNPEPLRQHIENLARRQRAPACPPMPELDAPIAAVAAAAAAAIHGRGTAVARRAELAELYRLALRSKAFGQDPCPLCESTDREWRSRVTEAEALLRESNEYVAVQRQFLDAQESLVSSFPVTAAPAVAEFPDLVLLAREVDDLWATCRRAVQGWTIEKISTDGVDVARTRIAAAADRHSQLIAAAAATTDDGSREAAERLRRFLEMWESDHETEARNRAASDLSGWLREETREARDVRAVELGDEAIGHFSRLCPEGGTVLEAYAPSGGVSRQQRMTTLVRLGTETGGAELLSTGQRNALCLAAFLPRTLREENPFRFLVLDDPVQAFDGGRVNYIAAMLSSASDKYQVIVLTLDPPSGDG